MIIGSVLVFLWGASGTQVFQARITGIEDVFSGVETTESSVLAIQSNFLVMVKSLETNLLCGGGLTSHRSSYFAFIDDLFFILFCYFLF